MPNVSKPDSHWIGVCNKLARGEVITGKGWKPGRGSKWSAKIDDIVSCPETLRLRQGGSSQPRFFATAASCKCGWAHNQTGTDENVNTAAVDVEPERPPPKLVDFGILKKPEPRRKIDEVRGLCKVYNVKGCYPLMVFGYYDGKCPHCGGEPDVPTRCGKVKIIHTGGMEPRFVQGVGMSCSNAECNQPGWQSLTKTYVDTLALWKQQELDAVVVGKSDGVAMDLVMQMRMGVTAATIEKTSRGNLERMHSALQVKYEEKCNGYTSNGIEVEEREFPDLDESLVAKSPCLVRAFLRDYATEMNPLLREMASITSKFTASMDHQFKVVGRAQGQKGCCSFVVVGDGGLVLGYYVVPDDALEWTHAAMKELVARHK